VQVSFLDNSPPQIILEEEVDVVDRSLHLGDVVKRRAEDMMSGIVSGGKMKLCLEHTFTGQWLENVDSEHIRSAFDFNEGKSLTNTLIYRTIYPLSRTLGRPNRRSCSRRDYPPTQ